MFWTVTMAALAVVLGLAWWRDHRESLRTRGFPEVRQQHAHAREQLGRDYRRDLSANPHDPTPGNGPPSISGGGGF